MSKKNKVGRPKKQIEEVQTDIISEVPTMTINFGGWVITGTGDLNQLQYVINQLAGVTNA